MFHALVTGMPPEPHGGSSGLLLFFEPMRLELHGPAVLGDRPNGLVRDALWDLGLNFQGISLMPRASAI